MKHLKIEYTTANGKTVVLFDDDINEVAWVDTATGVKVEGRFAPPAQNNNAGAGLLDLLTSASRARTESVANEKRDALTDEKRQRAAAVAAARRAKEQAAPVAQPSVAEETLESDDVVVEAPVVQG